jgi:hypothetical protein
MSRSEFLKSLWFRFLKPTIIIGIAVYLASFTKNIFAENGIERVTTYALLILGLLVFAVSMLEAWLGKIINDLKSKIPLKVKGALKIALLVSHYLLLIALGIILFYHWKQDWQATLLIIALLLTVRILDSVYKTESKSGS